MVYKVDCLSRLAMRINASGDGSRYRVPGVYMHIIYEKSFFFR